MDKIKEEAIWLALDLGTRLALVYAKDSLPHGPAQLTEYPHCGIGSNLMVIRLLIFFTTVSMP